MKKIIKINKLLFGLILMMNFNAISTFAMMETRDMPDMPLEKGKISREENKRKITYTHQAAGSSRRKVVEYDKQTDQYSAYSHHIPSGRTKRMSNPEETFHKYKSYHESTLSS